MVVVRDSGVEMIYSGVISVPFNVLVFWGFAESLQSLCSLYFKAVSWMLKTNLNI